MKIANTKGLYTHEHGIVVSGTPEAREKLKKVLTLKNKGVIYQINMLKKRVSQLEKRYALLEDSGEAPKKLEALQNRITEAKEEIKKLFPEINKEYWAEKGDTVEIPWGFWDFPETLINEEHLNTEIKWQDLPVIEGRKPRYYQEEAVKEMLKYKRASVVLPTGTGKSLVIAMMANAFVSSGKRVCVIVPTITLVEQTASFVKNYIPKTCALGGIHKFKLGSDVLVTTINSAQKYIDSFDCVLVDEFHHSAADSYDQALFMAASSKYFYGLTACPIRSDGLSLGIHANCGPIVYSVNTRKAIEEKFLVEPKIGMIEVQGLPRLPKDMNSQKAYGTLVGHNITKAVIYQLAKMALDKNKKTLILFKTVGAGDKFKEYCKGKLEFEVASSEYRKPLSDFRDGKTNILVANSGLMAEGVDIPSIDCVINVVQNSSENLTRQVIGRGLRLKEGKEYLSYYDIITPGFDQFMFASKSRRTIYESIVDNVKYFIR